MRSHQLALSRTSGRVDEERDCSALASKRHDRDGCPISKARRSSALRRISSETFCSSVLQSRNSSCCARSLEYQRAFSFIVACGRKARFTIVGETLFLLLRCAELLARARRQTCSCCGEHYCCAGRLLLLKSILRPMDLLHPLLVIRNELLRQQVLFILDLSDGGLCFPTTSTRREHTAFNMLGRQERTRLRLPWLLPFRNNTVLFPIFKSRLPDEMEETGSN